MDRSDDTSKNPRPALVAVPGTGTPMRGADAFMRALVEGRVEDIEREIDVRIARKRGLSALPDGSDG